MTATVCATLSTTLGMQSVTSFLDQSLPIIAPLLISYLGPIFDVASSQLLTALDGTGAREVGKDTAGTPTPTWELMVMAGSILLWMAMLVPAAWRAWRRGSLGPTRARYVPLVIAVLYPALQLAPLASNLEFVRRSVEQLALKQEQMARNIAALQAVDEDIRQKVSSPPPAPAQPAAAIPQPKPAPKPQQPAGAPASSAPRPSPAPGPISLAPSR